MRADKYFVEQLIDSIRAQIRAAEHPHIPSVSLGEFEWEVILALLTQELGVQSLRKVGLRETDAR